MSDRKQFATTLLGLAVLLLILVVVFYVGWKISSSPVAPTALTAAFGLVTAVAVQAYSHSIQKKKEIEAALREKKVSIYEGFIDLWFDDVFELSRNRRTKLTPITSKLHKQTKEIILWASDDVLVQYATFKRVAAGQPAGKLRVIPNNLVELESLMLSFRKDLGHKNKLIKSGDILCLFINDLYEPSDLSGDASFESHIA